MYTNKKMDKDDFFCVQTLHIHVNMIKERDDYKKSTRNPLSDIEPSTSRSIVFIKDGPF